MFKSPAQNHHIYFRTTSHLAFVLKWEFHIVQAGLELNLCLRMNLNSSPASTSAGLWFLPSSAHCLSSRTYWKHFLLCYIKPLLLCLSLSASSGLTLESPSFWTLTGIHMSFPCSPCGVALSTQVVATGKAYHLLATTLCSSKLSPDCSELAGPSH